MDDAIFAVTRGGLYRKSAHGFAWQPVLHPGAATLSDGNVSALATDSRDRLWVGYFDRGLDRLESDHGPATHVENEHVFCVNRILPNPKDGTIDVATANGLVRFDSAGSQEQVLTRADGFIADHVTDVAFYQDGLALATPAGLTFLDAAGARSMYAFQGLVNNHVYALGVSGDELMAGTLGGLSQLEKGNVQVNYTTATPGLKHNWITAVVPVGASGWLEPTARACSGLTAQATSTRLKLPPDPSKSIPMPCWSREVTCLPARWAKACMCMNATPDAGLCIEQGLPSANVTALAAGQRISLRRHGQRPGPGAGADGASMKNSAAHPARVAACAGAAAGRCRHPDPTRQSAA